MFNGIYRGHHIAVDTLKRETPVGYRNRYRFPRPEVAQRYARLRAKQYLSQEQGALTFVLGANGRQSGPSSYQESVRRYWYAEPE